MLRCMDLPRPVEQRIADTRRRLEEDADAWVATTDGSRPWLVPLSFVWHHDHLLFATPMRSATSMNVGRVPSVRVALGDLRDVVMIEGDAAVSALSALATVEIEAYQGKLGTDPRSWADAVIRVSPVRIQAWREENEEPLTVRPGRRPAAREEQRSSRPSPRSWDASQAGACPFPAAEDGRPGPGDHP